MEKTKISGLIGIILMSVMFAFVFAVPKTAAVTTYTYVVTNFGDASCSGSLDYAPSNLSSPGDLVTLLGAGFGNRSVSDNRLEMLYLPINNVLKMIYRAQRNEGGQSVYYGINSWSDSSIVFEVGEGQGGTLGSYFVFRQYNDNDNTTYSCYGGNLSIACDLTNYSDWGACQPNGTQARSITTSSPSGCSIFNPVLSQSCTYTPPACTSITYSDWGTCQSDSTQTRTIINSSPSGCSAVNPVLSRSCTLPTIYTATNFMPISCPFGADVTSGVVSSNSNVKIIGTGLGNRDISDGIPENIYLPSATPGKFYSISRERRDEGGPVYYGLMSWSDSEINTQVISSTANSLGSYVILRTYPGTRPDANGALSQSDCNRGNLTLGYICSSFTYSDWGVCTNGQQTRSITSSFPSSCTGGNPLLTQTCTPTCTLNDYTCGNWDSCSADGAQVRTCAKNSTCEGGVSPQTSQSCTYTAPLCTSWTYSDWGVCTTNEQQTRTIVTSLPAGCAGGNPALSQNCTLSAPICTADTWACADWSTCSINNSQTRTCTKTLDCPNIDTASPSLSQSCTFNPGAPVITSISPEMIEQGTNVTLRGAKFMNISGRYIFSCTTCKVFINGSEVSGVAAYNWTEDSVSFSMPANATSGYIQVQDSKGNISEKFNFTIKTFADQNPINISSVSPTSVIPGDIVTVIGSGFGEKWYSDTSIIVGGVDLQTVVSWNDTKIELIFPITGLFGQKVRIKKCKYSWSTNDDECSFAVSNETISLKKNSNDPLSGLQWYLENTNVLQAWQITQGSQDVVVAVIDSGVDTNHEDLTHSIWLNQREIENNGIDDDRNGYIDDKKGWNFAYNFGEMTPYKYDSHGTNVAGVIASKKDNQIGIAGIAPNVKIMPLTVFDMPNAEGKSSASLENIVKAVKYAVDNGADIINLSLGGVGKTNDYSNSFDEIFQYAYDHNVLIVTAAGNGDIYGQTIGYSRGQNLAVNPDSPVCNDGDKNWVVGVGASNNENLRTAWSNYGACIDVWAPGEDIVTASLPPNNYASVDGTSFSAPIVSGIAALIKSTHPDWNVEEIKTVLINSQTNLIIDANKAVTASRPNVSYRPNIATKLDESNFQNITIVDTKPDDSRDEKPIAVEIPFPDIHNSKYQEAINILKQKGFVAGNPDGSFKPLDTLNRAEMLTILMHNLPDEIPEVPEGGCGFSDVLPSQWFTKFICFAKANGLAAGYPDGTFKPANKVNFVEALALTERAFDWEISEDEEVWYRPFVIYAEAKNIIPESITSFGQEITREEMAELVVRFLKDKEGTLDSYLGTKAKSSKITYVCLKNGTCNGADGDQDLHNVSPSYIEVIVSSVRVRDGIGYDAAILENASLGQRFEIISEQDGWFQIKRTSGGMGWIEGKWVKRID